MAHITILDQDNPSKKRYKVIYEVDDISGKRKRKSKTFQPHTPLAKVKEFVNAVELEHNKDNAISYDCRTLRSFFNEYIDVYTHDLSKSTVQSYVQIANADPHGILRHLGHIELSKLSTTKIQKYVNYLTDDGLSPKTIKNYMSVLHSVMDRAIKCRYIQRGANPVSEVETPKVRHKRIQSYNPDEVQILLYLADTFADEITHFLIYLSVGTGARRSEMAAIRIEDVDLYNRVWHITQSKISIAGSNDILKEPKTESGIRDIPLSESLCAEIKKMIRIYNQNKLKHGNEFNDSRFLFSDEYGIPLSTDSLSKTFTRFVKSHSEKLRYLSLHSAGRHSYASIAIANGTDIKTVQEILGHSSATITLDTYASSYFEKKLSYADKLENLIFTSQKAQ
ncbi:tyrosine-type recombinase/integrase [Butyrivibrio sp. NC2002]|uniref:tyrosine-type recombinase/integrase n=1 Tax=Butyrivibrio sp. NC2002 TaxID=1410610 RepID=UPI000569BA8F|nr:site-specific integrase [Butyrivibrio sp. NC2002]